jgi:glutathione S-transferase
MSANLKFYFAPGSPPARACLMLIKKLELNVEVISVNLAAGEQNQPEFLKLNPLHQVPVLVDGDFVLTESRAIQAYLVNKFQPGSSLYPNDPQARAVVDQRLYYDATVVFESAAQIIVRATEAKVRATFSILFSFAARRVVQQREENPTAEPRETHRHSQRFGKPSRQE